MNYSNLYKNTIKKNLLKTLKLENIHMIPKIEKIVLTAGVGKYSKDKEALRQIESDLASLSGQYPTSIRAKKSVDGFSIHKGNMSAYRLTLRGVKAYTFLEKTIEIALPQVNGFLGLEESSLTEVGNLNFGIENYSCYPEVGFSNVNMGIGITIVTSSKNRSHCREMFREFNIPFKKDYGRR